MDAARWAREYVSFGLTCERLLPGLVDCYVGASEPRRRTASEPTPTPTSLAARARWLRAELQGAGMPETSRDFLDRQLVALQLAVRRVAGATVGYRAEVLAYFDTEIAPGEPDGYRAAHSELAEVLPGHGPLAPRLAAYRERTRLSAGLVAPALQRVAQALREPARRHFGLPPEEAAFFELVTDRPWSAFHSYLGGHHSRISVNTDVGLGPIQLARLVAHEAYPGHHTEYVGAALALRDPEAAGARSLFLMNTPQCLISEGQADLGLEVLLGPGYAAWTLAVLEGLAPDMDAELAERVDRAMEALLPVRQDAALLLHDRGRPETEVSAYLRRWLLVDEPRTRQMLRFITHPRWRAYTTTYVEGRRLVRRWLNAGPPEESVTERYFRLREEPRSPSALRALLAG